MRGGRVDVYGMMGWKQVRRVRRQLCGFETFCPRIPDAGEEDARWERCI